MITRIALFTINLTPHKVINQNHSIHAELWARMAERKMDQAKPKQFSLILLPFSFSFSDKIIFIEKKRNVRYTAIHLILKRARREKGIKEYKQD